MSQQNRRQNQRSRASTNDPLRRNSSRDLSRSAEHYNLMSESESESANDHSNNNNRGSGNVEEIEMQDIQRRNSSQPSPLDPLPKLNKEERNFFEKVESGDLEAVEEIIASDNFNIDIINKVNRMGYSVLHLAVLGKHVEIVKLLLEQHWIRLYDTILLAIKAESVEITHLLLEYHDKHIKTPSSSKHDQGSLESNSPSQLMTPMSARSKTGLKTSIAPPNALPRPKKHVSSIHLADEEGYDSEFNPVITPLMLAAEIGNTKMMEIFYNRGERLETEEFPHNKNCDCDICEILIGEHDMTRAHKRLHLFKSLSSPKYICFIARKEKKDPINYAIDKIIKLRKIMNTINVTKLQYKEDISILENFIVDMLDLCQTTAETEIFMSQKDSKGIERLPYTYPRLWYVVGLKLKKVVAHHNAQTMIFKMWATDGWPSWDTYNKRQKFGCLLLRTPPGLFIVSAILWFCPSGNLLASPVSRFMNYLVSYTIFLLLLAIQVLSPYQRCNDEPPYYKIDEEHCKKRGPPNIGTEWVIVIYVVSFWVSFFKKQRISWYWKMKWNWIDLAMLISFSITFICWGWSWLWIKNPIHEWEIAKDKRVMWPHNCPEILGDCFLAVATCLACSKLLQFTQVFPWIGHIQIGLGEQITDFLSTAGIFSVVLVAFATGLLGLYVPYKGCVGKDKFGKSKTQDQTFTSMPTTLGNLFWYLYGMSSRDPAMLLSWEVQATNASTIIELEQDESDSGQNTTHLVQNTTELLQNGTELIHHTYTENTGLALYFFYHLFGSMMMFQMLTGYFAIKLNEIMDEIDMHWKFNRTEMYLTFMKDTVLPPPFNLIPPWENIVKMFTCLFETGTAKNPSHRHGSACYDCVCCYPPDEAKTKSWKSLDEKYKPLIVTLIYRYNEFHDVIDEIALDVKPNERKEKERRELFEFLGRNPDGSRKDPPPGSGAVGGGGDGNDNATGRSSQIQSSEHGTGASESSMSENNNRSQQNSAASGSQSRSAAATNVTAQPSSPSKTQSKDVAIPTGSRSPSSSQVKSKTTSKVTVSPQSPQLRHATTPEFNTQAATITMDPPTGLLVNLNYPNQFNNNNYQYQDRSAFDVTHGISSPQIRRRDDTYRNYEWHD